MFATKVGPRAGAVVSRIEWRGIAESRTRHPTEATSPPVPTSATRPEATSPLVPPIPNSIRH